MTPSARRAAWRGLGQQQGRQQRIPARRGQRPVVATAEQHVRPLAGGPERDAAQLQAAEAGRIDLALGEPAGVEAAAVGRQRAGPGAGPATAVGADREQADLVDGPVVAEPCEVARQGGIGITALGDCQKGLEDELVRQGVVRRIHAETSIGRSDIFL